MGQEWASISRGPLEAAEAIGATEAPKRPYERRTFLTADDEEPAEVVVYCPECDEREFGEQ